MESPMSWLGAWVGGIPALIFAAASLFMTFQHYLIAELGFWIAGVWTLIAWRFSNFLQRGEKEIARLRRKAEKSTANRSARAAYEKRRFYYNFYERSISIGVGIITERSPPGRSPSGGASG